MSEMFVYGENSGEVESDPWKEQVPLFSGSMRVAGSERVLVGRTIAIGEVVGRWCKFVPVSEISELRNKRAQSNGKAKESASKGNKTAAKKQAATAPAQGKDCKTENSQDQRINKPATSAGSFSVHPTQAATAARTNSSSRRRIHSPPTSRRSQSGQPPVKRETNINSKSSQVEPRSDRSLAPSPEPQRG
ncbi:MAG: hypothetical protein Q9217_002680 [Psora testacea]